MAPTKKGGKSRSQLTFAEKALIKAEQSPFVEKLLAAQLNDHQRALIEAAQTQTGQYVVLAGPGCGKTFSSIKASSYFTTGKAIYFAYNKKIQFDTNFKLIAIDSKMVASTTHSFGLSCLQAYTRGQCTIDTKEEKYPTLITKYLTDTWQWFLGTNRYAIEQEELNVDAMHLDAYTWTKSLIHYAQVSLAELTPRGLTALVEAFDLTDIKLTSLVWPFVLTAVPAIIEQGIGQFLGTEHLVTFDDMIYYPNVIPNVPIRQYHHVIVDEAQDTSRAGLELILKACHAHTQIFFVGDPKQSVYLFAGATHNAIDEIITRLNAATLPLRICYRCGSHIVELANQLGGQLISAGIHTGHVEVIPQTDYLDQLRPGDAVLARTTVRLVEGCLKTLQTGRKAKVLGKNIGDNIAAVVSQLEARRISRGVPELHDDLSNLLQVLDDYQSDEALSLQESRKHPEMALAELSDKVDTVRAFFEAYISKCHHGSLRTEHDPKCSFSKTAKDFKAYIHGLFSEDDNTKDFILFMTAHRSKGGEWENVYIIGTDEFPHPKAKSDRQQQQESNLMYVAVTRAITNLFFVGAPFSCLDVTGYEPDEQQKGLTIISYPAAEHLEIHPHDEEPQVVPPILHHDELSHEEEWRETYQDEEHQPSLQHVGTLPEATTGKVGRALAIEVLCPTCNNGCVDPKTGSFMITEDLIGHTVVCSSCHKESLVPLNAFSLTSQQVTAAEKPTGKFNNKGEKVGRTVKERKSNAGRKAKSGVVRQPRQLSLDVRTIATLDAMGINNSELFETLLRQYEPFTNTWTEMGYEVHQEEE